MVNKYGVPGRYQKVKEHCYGSTNGHIPASWVFSSRGVETLNNHSSCDKCRDKNAKCFERCGDSQERGLWESGIEAEEYLNSEKKIIPGRRNSRKELGAPRELKGGPRGWRTKIGWERENERKMKRKTEGECARAGRSILLSDICLPSDILEGGTRNLSQGIWSVWVILLEGGGTSRTRTYITCGLGQKCLMQVPKLNNVSEGVNESFLSTLFWWWPGLKEESWRPQINNWTVGLGKAGVPVKISVKGFSKFVAWYRQ